jgi:hypothetical protein
MRDAKKWNLALLWIWLFGGQWWLWRSVELKCAGTLWYETQNQRLAALLKSCSLNSVWSVATDNAIYL